MQLTKRAQGTQAELIVQRLYEDEGRTLREHSYCIRGGELDLVMERDGCLLCVEVKAVEQYDDLHGYVTPRKLARVRRTFMQYVSLQPQRFDLRIDVVFVRNSAILTRIENIDVF